MLNRLCIALVTLTFACGAALAAQDPQQVEAGKKLYDVYDRKKCHRIGGASGKLHSLEGVATKMSAEDIRKWLVSPAEMTKTLKKKPTTTMKKQAFKPGEIDAFMAYLATLK